MDVKEAESKGIRFAQLAINHDTNSDLEAALASYREAVHYLLIARDEGSSLPRLTDKIRDYVNRAEIISKTLKEKKSKEGLNSFNSSDEDQSVTGLTSRVQFLLNQALEEDAQGNHKSAIEMYLDAVEVCLKVKDSAEDEKTKVKLSKLATDALSRAEELSGNSKDPINEAHKNLEKLNLQEPVNSNANNSRSVSPVHDSYSSLKTTRSSLSEKRLSVVGQTSYTKEEIAVIRKTSVINGIEYLPFLAIDLKERFAFPLPFTDKIGYLSLSSKQKRCFHRWSRLEELCSQPMIIKEVDCFSVKQTLVSDCSFIASLTVAALYEKRFKKKLITNIIYPQNRARQPVYNPCGKYMIKLHINGLDRKVIIDDFFPVDINNGLLCSHSVNHDEFWVSILEKAYMKVMGGYDFPGSNSSIDLNALTGWIPERLTTKDSLMKMFRPLVERYHRGDVLLTVATGDLSEFDQERSGLVPNHAYAVLDLREVDGHKLLLLKNPWRHLSWKGNFSDADNVNWSPSLKQKLNYDPRSARNHDIGVFWIDAKSLIHFFDTMYCNWSCSLFKYTFCTHGCWSAGLGPSKDLYNIGDNPQFSLDVSADNTTVWVLLTRHIVDKQDFAQNREFITLVVYKGSDKVYLPFDPPPYIDGVRINSPHYLCKINIPEGGSTKYVLAISQYEKTTTIYYTIRVYSNVVFNFKKLVENYQYIEKITNGSWDDQTAGGCANHQATYNLNPVYMLEVKGSDELSNELLIDLKGPKQYSVGFEVKTVTPRNPASPNLFKHVHSGPYRSGFTILKLKKVPPGSYHIIPSTFEPHQKGPFFLTVKSSCPIKVSRIK